MKKRFPLVVCIAFLALSLVACGQKETPATSLPSLTEVREDVNTPEGGGTADNGGTTEGGGTAPVPLPEEPDFVDDGEAAANVADEEVVTGFGFTMAYPGEWAYLSMEELMLDSYYIFAAGNRATGGSIVVSQPLDAEGESLAPYADRVYAASDETIALYEGMGISCELRPMADDTLGGRSAKRIDLYCQSSEAEFVQTTYVVDTPTGEVITVAVSTYGDEDAAAADEALASIAWG